MSTARHVPRSNTHFEVEPAVFIVESFGADEIAQQEALPLAVSLASCGVPHIAARVASEIELASSLELFGVIARSRPSGLPIVPTIHLAAHGNTEGVRLAENFVPWSRLRAVLLSFAESADRMTPRGLAMVNLCLSTCRGLYARRMFDEGPPYPCFGIIGSHSDIWSNDALEAFVRYYFGARAQRLAGSRRSPPHERARWEGAFRLRDRAQCRAVAEPRWQTSSR